MKYYPVLVFLTLSLGSAAQSSAPKDNWQLLDWKADGYPGMSVEKAYKELLTKKKPKKKIIVAVIDDGLDSTHPDLAGIQWTNTREIPGNGIDDDGNGYIDDVHGWNFVGNDRRETYEEVREYVRLRRRFADTTAMKNDSLYPYWQRISAAEATQVSNQHMMKEGVTTTLNTFKTLQDWWAQRMPAGKVTLRQIVQDSGYAGADSSILQAREYILGFKEKIATTPDTTSLVFIINSIQPYYDEAAMSVAVIDTLLTQDDPGYFRTKYLNDNPYINTGKAYGNANTFPEYPHGTECAGVIAALRHNGFGGDGIAGAVAIMPIRINAMGHNQDEWDKDVANAIRYAADNGAQVVSMSFTKYYSPQKQWVEQAVAYARSKNVLLIRAAGNDHADLDSLESYPEEYYPARKGAGKDARMSAANLIVVGASSYDSSLVANFSNYGAHKVDVFAPGMNVYMPMPGGGYERGQGTSFACPMVAGVAALIWSYYPQLSWRQVRDCIERSATPIDMLVENPGTGERVAFKTLSRTGGIVNAYRALQLAAATPGTAATRSTAAIPNTAATRAK